MVVSRFDVYLIALDPTVGHEMQKTRPCVIVSPNDLNRQVRTVIVAPMTSRSHGVRFRAACRFQGRTGEIALDQIRAVDQSRLVKRLGRISSQTQTTVLQILERMFAP